MITSSLSDR